MEDPLEFTVDHFRFCRICIRHEHMSIAMTSNDATLAPDRGLSSYHTTTVVKSILKMLMINDDCDRLVKGELLFNLSLISGKIIVTRTEDEALDTPRT